MRKIVFGPVPSRRLGLSLGIDIIPMKTCTYSCVYCQIGRTPETTVERKSYVSTDEVIDEINKALVDVPPPDFMTFSGSGEPTLNSEIGAMIAAIKGISDTPVAVITNGSLLWRDDVRRDLSGADLVVPSLDAVSKETFLRLNRPHPEIDLDRMIDGLRTFSREFSGKIWLEVMIVAGVNDSDDELKRIADVISGMDVDLIHLNTPVRPPAEDWVKPVNEERMVEIREIFGEKALVIANFSRNIRKIYGANESGIVSMLSRRPCTLADISNSLGIEQGLVRRSLDSLIRRGLVREIQHDGQRYYVTT